MSEPKKPIKARLVVHFTLDYEIDPDNYPAVSTPEEMLQVDMDNYRDCPEDLLADDKVVVTTTGEILKFK